MLTLTFHCLPLIRGALPWGSCEAQSWALLGYFESFCPHKWAWTSTLCLNSCLLSWWCHPAISSSVVPFSSCPQSLPATESFPMKQLFTWGGQILEFQLYHHSFQRILGLISFRMDWLDLLAVQGTLKSLLQHHSSKASILWRLASFTVQLWHPYMTTGNTIALTRRTFVGKVTSLLLNILSRLVMTFLPRSKRLLISWLQLDACYYCPHHWDIEALWSWYKVTFDGSLSS